MAVLLRMPLELLPGEPSTHDGVDGLYGGALGRGVGAGVNKASAG